MFVSKWIHLSIPVRLTSSADISAHTLTGHDISWVRETGIQFPCQPSCNQKIQSIITLASKQAKHQALLVHASIQAYMGYPQSSRQKHWGIMGHWARCPLHFNELGWSRKLTLHTLSDLDSWHASCLCKNYARFSPMQSLCHG